MFLSAHMDLTVFPSNRSCSLPIRHVVHPSPAPMQEISGLAASRRRTSVHCSAYKIVRPSEQLLQCYCCWSLHIRLTPADVLVSKRLPIPLRGCCHCPSQQ